MTFAASLLALAACGPSGTGNPPGPPGGAMPPMPVKVSQPLQKNVTEWDEYTGRIEAVESVQIRARVTGYLDRINFKDGARVQKGDLLFVIDPRPYQADLARAEGEVERVKAQVERARNDLARGEKLRRSKAMSEEEYDARSKGLREAQAALRSAEAAVRTARLNIDFTQVRAPISGRIGRELITVGNLVRADDTVLSTLVSVDPVYVFLDADERAVLRYRRMAQGQKQGAAGPRIPAELALADETAFPHRGYIDYADPWLEPGTGTLRTRGVFSNGDGILSAGLFARVRIPGGSAYPALLLPDRALGTDQGDKFIWIAKDDGSVEYRKVVPGARFGALRAIKEGLGPNDWVVVEGGQKLRPGAKVVPEKVPVTDAAPETEARS